MLKKYDLIIFDWDGTIIDSQAHIINCMQNAIADTSLPVPQPDEIRHIIGLSLPRAIETLFPDIDAGQVEQVAASYRDHFFADSTQASELFHGAAEVIQDLHAQGYYLAVATGKGRRGLDIALEKTGLQPYFHITRCADETHSKPDPLMLEEILTDLDLDSSRAVMVGDTSYDMDMAHNIKMDSIAVTYGMHDHQVLQDSHPTHFIDSIEQITQIV
ncbi:MAG: HAD-IA family hydrolase [Gammaproteobacteria bacterium]|nr:HAD-IA family hydrolase [Gammaproteobacteria bacterium]